MGKNWQEATANEPDFRNEHKVKWIRIIYDPILYHILPLSFAPAQKSTENESYTRWELMYNVFALLLLATAEQRIVLLLSNLLAFSDQFVWSKATQKAASNQSPVIYRTICLWLSAV